MEKRLLLAFALSMLVVVSYPYVLQKIYGPFVTTTGRQAQSGSVSSQPPVAPPLTTPSQTPHSQVPFETKEVLFLIDEESASVSQVILKNYFDSQGKQDKLAVVVDTPYNIAYMWIENPKIDPIKWSKVESNTQKISFLAETGTLRIKKSFLQGRTGFDLVVEIEVEDISSQPASLYFGLVGPSSLIQTKEDNRFFKLVASSQGKMNRYKLNHIQGSAVNENSHPAAWLAIKGKYFSLIAKPESSNGGYFVRAVPGTEEACLGFWSQPTELTPTQLNRNRFIFYAGPNTLSILSQLGKWAEETMDFGLFGGVAKFLLKGLLFLKRLTGSYGISIIFMTCLINLLFLPLSFKSYNSMSKMRLLQPEMAKLRELYKDKPQKLNKEVMELYRRHKVNPLSGCLPLLFQTPIFISFYRILAGSIELKGASFLFIKDLSSPDKMIRFPFSLWPVGTNINLLPILMIGAMLIQQRLSQPLSSSIPEDETQQAMKFMPLFFGVIFYGLPSGLVLYWLTNTLLSIGTQRLFLRQS